MRIFLIGFMGSGKSYWGNLWAKTEGLSYVDLDEEIEAQEHGTIAETFEMKGEDYFRKKEAEVLRSLISNTNCIISCGGGSPCFFDNIDWMNEHGITVFLDASPEYILENIKHEKEKRPLLKDTNEADLLFFIEKKLKERMSFYQKAKLTLPASYLNMDSIKEIIK
jgi:shikimate kinase